VSSSKQKMAQKSYEAWNTGNVDLLDEVCAPNLVYHLPPFPDMDLAGLKEYVTGLRLGFPDFKVWEDEFIDGGETTVTRYTNTATFTGETPAMPFPPTGASSTTTGAVVAAWRGGKMVEVWHFHDMLGDFQQLGIIPPMG
jgi:ketosteroid isomerase-like protein